MPSRHNLDIPFFTGAVAVTRFAFRSHYLYDIDSVNFALAIHRFDPRVHQPHPPGYFLYICMGRALNSIFHNTNLALVVLSILAGCGTVTMIYRLALDWFDISTARMAALVFLFSPLAWFHGTVALTYSVEAFFSSLLGYLCWKILDNGPQFIVATGVLLGISAGVRPSSLLFLGPLYLFALFHASPRRRIIGIAALSSTILAWFLPMIAASGGFRAYFEALFSLWQLVPSRDTVFNSSPATSIARACTIFLILLLCFGTACLALFWDASKPQVVDRRKRVFTAVWCVPALSFFTFIFLKFVNSGYLLIVAAPSCLWLGRRIVGWYEGSGWGIKSKLAAMTLGALANTAIFLASPFYCSYRSVRRFELNLESVQMALPQVASSRDAFIVGFDSHFLGYRHAGYYLPGYLTLEYPAVKLLEGPRIFSMRERDTHLLTHIQTGSRSRFILFPLPDGDASYRAYIETVKGKLPTGSLQIVRVGSHDFVTGAVSELPRLFPGMPSSAQ